MVSTNKYSKVLLFEISVTLEGSLMDLSLDTLDYSYTTKMRQFSLSVGLNYRF